MKKKKSQKIKKKDVFGNKIKENRTNEQFFWTINTVKQLMNAFKYTYECCCLTTPSLGHAFHEAGRDEKVLDIDDRFKYLPKFEKFDIKNPHNLDETFNVIVIDPPFFVITLKELYDAVNIITKNNFDTKIVIGFLARHNKLLLETFKKYGISETKTKLEYAHIKPHKWHNFKLYSNVDLPGIKRITDKHHYKN